MARNATLCDVERLFLRTMGVNYAVAGKCRGFQFAKRVGCVADIESVYLAGNRVTSW